MAYLTSRNLLRNDEKIVITFDVINDNVRLHRSKYQRLIKGLKEEISALIQKPLNCIDILKPTPILNGVNITIKVSIETFMSVKKDVNRMSQISDQNIQSFYNVITTHSIIDALKQKKVWNLKKENILIDNLEIFEVKSKSRRLESMKSNDNWSSYNSGYYPI